MVVLSSPEVGYWSRRPTDASPSAVTKENPVGSADAIAPGKRAPPIRLSDLEPGILDRYYSQGFKSQDQ